MDRLKTVDIQQFLIFTNCKNLPPLFFPVIGKNFPFIVKQAFLRAYSFSAHPNFYHSSQKSRPFFGYFLYLLGEFAYIYIFLVFYSEFVAANRPLAVGNQHRYWSSLYTYNFTFPGVLLVTSVKRVFLCTHYATFN